ncbi:hypothetical protein [Nocardia tengchongensis]|uniref:hypothetical protein n=1 Tax=Nocardia tengchongensis TaxID=2055889 RepID=UPI00364CF3E2
MRIRRWRRAYLAAEYAALFFGGTTLYNAVLRGKPPIPALGLGRHFYHGAAPAARIQLGATGTA